MPSDNTKKKTKFKDSPFLHPKNIHDVYLFVTKCLWAYGFGCKSNVFKCNPNLFMRNIKVEECEDKCILDLDIDFDNGERLVSRHINRTYDLTNYKMVIKLVKKTISQAEELCKTVFVGDSFKEKVFMMMRLDLDGWNLIR